MSFLTDIRALWKAVHDLQISYSSTSHDAVTLSVVGLGLTNQHIVTASGYSIPTISNQTAWSGAVTLQHTRGHTFLSTTDHTDVATYIDQPLLTSSSPRFANLTLTGGSLTLLDQTINRDETLLGAGTPVVKVSNYLEVVNDIFADDKIIFNQAGTPVNLYGNAGDVTTDAGYVATTFVKSPYFIIPASPSDIQMEGVGGLLFINTATYITGDMVSNSVVAKVSSSASYAFRSWITGEGAYRLEIYGDGDLYWGNGTNPVDTNLYRLTANVLQTDDTFVCAALTCNSISGTQVTTWETAAAQTHVHNQLTDLETTGSPTFAEVFLSTASAITVNCTTVNAVVINSSATNAILVSATNGSIDTINATTINVESEVITGTGGVLNVSGHLEVDGDLLAQSTVYAYAGINALSINATSANIINLTATSVTAAYQSSDGSSGITKLVSVGTWTKITDMSVLPSADGWTYSGTIGELTACSVSNGILTMNNTGAGAVYCRYLIDPAFDSTIGYSIELKMQLVSVESTGFVYIWFQNVGGAKGDYFEIKTSNIQFEYASAGTATYSMDTTDTFHIYRIVVLGTNAKVYVDGVLRLNSTLTSGGNPNNLVVGDENGGGTANINTQWNYIKYYTGAGKNMNEITIKNGIITDWTYK